MRATHGGFRREPGTPVRGGSPLRKRGMRGAVLRAAGLALPVGLALFAAGAAGGVPDVPGFVVEIYADVPGPVELDFDASGNLFCGRDIPGTGGHDSVKIHRVGPGGTPVVEYGASVIRDPDAVLVDRDGSISGTAGAVVVCGDGGSGGKIVAVLPDESIVTLHESYTMSNPSASARGRDGLLLSDWTLGKVYEYAPPGPPTVLIGSPGTLAVHPDDRIFVCHDDGVVRVYDADGALLDGSFATLSTESPMAFGTGGAFGTDLYAVKRDSGELVRIAPDGTPTVIGTGFPTGTFGIEFGPDGALYAADFEGGRVLRIASLVPSAPSGLAAAAASPFRIDLSWADGGAEEEAYEVERSVEGAAFAALATVAADVTTYSDIGREPMRTYAYRVRAINSWGASDYAATSAATTPGTIDLVAVKGKLRDAERGASDSFKASGTLAFNGFAADQAFDPVTDGLEVSFGDPGNLFALVVPAASPGWKAKNGKYTWKSAKGESPRVKLVLDFPKGKFSLAAKSLDLPGTPQDQVRILLRCGNDAAAGATAWTADPRKPGVLNLKP